MPWGETGSLLYFIAVVAVVYVSAIVVLNRRDA
jgi:ABC-2 type transport system permease protein